MSEWQACTLSDVLKFGNGKSRPKESGEIPVYGGNGILDYTNCSNYSDETIVIGRVGAYCGATYYENQEIWVSDNALSAKALYGNDTKFLYYFLKNLDLNQFAQGSSHPLLTQTLLNSIEVGIPSSLPEQKAIASVLSSLDDKIDLLHRQNKTLEAMAETLFRHWFIGEAKEDWSEFHIRDLEIYIADYVANGSFASLKENVTLITEKSDYALFIRNTDLKSNFANKVYVDEHSYNFLAKTKLYGGEVIISNVADVGSVHLCPRFNVPMTLGNNIIMLRSKFNYFLYLYFTSNIGQDALYAITSGSAQQKFNKTDFRALKISLPNLAILDEFNELVSPYFIKKEYNLNQIQTLENLRDTLLPKLMNGEVRVQYQTEDVA